MKGGAGLRKSSAAGSGTWRPARGEPEGAEMRELTGGGDGPGWDLHRRRVAVGRILHGGADLREENCWRLCSGEQKRRGGGTARSGEKKRIEAQRNGSGGQFWCNFTQN